MFSRCSFWGCAKFVLLFLAVFAVFGWWNFFVDVPLKIRPETTVLTEPLTRNGMCVDYAAYFRTLEPKEMKSA